VSEITRTNNSLILILVFSKNWNPFFWICNIKKTWTSGVLKNFKHRPTLLPHKHKHYHTKVCWRQHDIRQWLPPEWVVGWIVGWSVNYSYVLRRVVILWDWINASHEEQSNSIIIFIWVVWCSIYACTSNRVTYMDCDLTYEILNHQVIFWKVALLFLLELYGIISTCI